MTTLLKQIKAGKVYRRSDLEYYTTSIDRDLAQLTKEGKLVKLHQGLYYAPKQSKFGIVPPDDHLLISSFLKDDDFLIVSPNAYNSLGIGLTQLYNTTWVYNHKRNGEFQLNGKSFIFKNKTAFPKSISKAYLLIDLLNNLDELAEDQVETSIKVYKTLENFEPSSLMKLTQLYGSSKTKRIVKFAIRKIQLNDVRLHTQ
jgi:hypothetical protein